LKGFFFFFNSILSFTTRVFQFGGGKKYLNTNIKKKEKDINRKSKGNLGLMNRIQQGKRKLG
jgi:hypothetical protein